MEVIHFLFSTPLVLIIILIALIFDFYNGMNDAANSIATVVSTQVLKPWQAVIWAAFFNFVAFAGGYVPVLNHFLGLHVATTIGKGIVHTSIVDPYVILATLVGAVIWSAICTHSGLPISISHALVGGFSGVAVVKAGTGALVMSGITKTLIFIVLSPLLGMLFGWILMVAVFWICRDMQPRKIDKHFRHMQLVSAASYSLSHGANDAQKTMGIIAILLFTTAGSPYAGLELTEKTFPIWVVIACFFVIAMGTLAGGWHVIKTLGQKVTKLKPVHGFCAETGGALSIFIATALGAPVSTTHTITGSIIGVGTIHRLSAVRWGVARRIVMAWVLTIPASAIMSALTWYVIKLLFL